MSEEINRRFYLTFSSELIKKPIIHEIGHKFKIVTNIRTASVSDELGLVALEMIGEYDEIEKAASYLKKIGVLVEPIEKSVVE